MKILIFLLLSFHSWSSYSAASKPRHMLSIGQNGIGWEDSRERIDADHDSPFREVENLLNNLSLNYAFRIFEHWQIGGYFRNSINEYKFKRAHDESFSKQKYTEYGVFLTYNFSKLLSQSFYLGGVLSFFNVEEENSHDFTVEEGKAPLELDDDGRSYEVFFGKRFLLVGSKRVVFTYSPEVSIFVRKHGKDFADQYVTKGQGFRLQFLKFDLMF